MKIVFISYDEPNAEHNFQLVRQKAGASRVIRVHGVKGIHRAHQLASRFVDTEFMWVVDGDAELTKDFNFELPFELSTKHMYVWRSINPINNLVYGYGGVKLLPTQKVRDMRMDTVDMTSSLDCWYKTVSVISNITAFNSSPFHAWKGAFREVVKLLKNVIVNADKATGERIHAWCTIYNDVDHASWVKRGVADALSFVESGYSVSSINDVNFLSKFFYDKYKCKY